VTGISKYETREGRTQARLRGREIINAQRDQLIRQVPQAGIMPLYANNLSPAETTAPVAFLETLRPRRKELARDASSTSRGLP